MAAMNGAVQVTLPMLNRRDAFAAIILHTWLMRGYELNTAIKVAAEGAKRMCRELPPEKEETDEHQG
jgi:hypothetical protein